MGVHLPFGLSLSKSWRSVRGRFDRLSANGMVSASGELT